MEEDEDAPSPRTLRAAAERLAQYTSEEVAQGEAPMGGRFADLYAEVGAPARQALSLSSTTRAQGCTTEVMGAQGCRTSVAAQAYLSGVKAGWLDVSGGCSQEGPDDESAAGEPDCMACWYSCRKHAEPATPSVHEGREAPAGAFSATSACMRLWVFPGSQAGCLTVADSQPCWSAGLLDMGQDPRHEAEEALHAAPALIREVSCAPFKLLVSQSPAGDRSVPRDGPHLL
jgi:hypothetical protein